MWRQTIAGLENDAALLPAMGEFLDDLDYWVDELARLETRHQYKLDHYTFCMTTFDD